MIPSEHDLEYTQRRLQEQQITPEEMRVILLWDDGVTSLALFSTSFSLHKHHAYMVLILLMACVRAIRPRTRKQL